MISPQKKAFRNEYRSRILGWYDGYFHIFIIYAMGGAAFYIYVEHIHDVTLLEWLTVPLTFLFKTFFEWAVHKFIMLRSSSVFYRRGNAVSRSQGLAGNRLSALRARGLHPHVFFFSSRRRHTILVSDWSSDVCSSD